MPESTVTDNRTLARRTLITVGVMVGACVVVVGTLTLVASAIAGHTIESQQAADGGSAAPQSPPIPLKTTPGKLPKPPTEIAR